MGDACSTYGGEKMCVQGFGEGNLRKRDHLEDPCVDVRIILRCTFRKWDVEAWNGLSWLRIGTVGGHL
jgi:hypothetical protein